MASYTSYKLLQTVHFLAHPVYVSMFTIVAISFYSYIEKLLLL